MFRNLDNRIKVKKKDLKNKMQSLRGFLEILSWVRFEIAISGRFKEIIQTC